MDNFIHTSTFKVDDNVQKSFDKNGFIVLRGVISTEEVEKLINFFENDETTQKNAYGREDGADRMTKLALWNQPGDDIAGTVPKMEKFVGTLEALMGGHEMYHYHSKLMMKEAEIGGQHVWHQDYGYWYHNGCLYPHMASIFIALDRCTTENSCLQVLPGSHLMGRIEHGIVGNKDGKEVKQQGADLSRVELIQEVCPQVAVELEPGDAIYFHSNLLHCSYQNFSKMRRWAMICSYNQARNDPVIKHHHPGYTRMERLPNDALMTCTNMTSSIDKEYLDPFDDISVKQ